MESGVETYETLNSNTSDKYQYILPYYNFEWFIKQDYFNGNFNLSSNGANNLKETNQLETSVINNLNYTSNNFYWNNELKAFSLLILKMLIQLVKIAQSTSPPKNRFNLFDKYRIKFTIN